VFDFDDAVLYRDSYAQRGPHSRSRTRRFAHTVQTADTIVAGNDFLADLALRAGATPDCVHVIPTCVDACNTPMSAQRFPVDLVWIGSSSTLRGLEQARPIWEAVAAAIPGLSLRLICDRFPDSFPLPILPVKWNRETEGQDIAAGQIGISWIPDDLWSRGKCGLKILQYQAAGLPVIANPVGAHREMVRDDETGFLATTADEWVLAVSRLVSDPRARQRMGLAARRQVEADYSVPAWSETFVTSVTGGPPLQTVSACKADRPEPPRLRRGLAPHRARARINRPLNQIGDR